MIANTYNLGVRQSGALRKAIIESVKKRENYDSDLEAIANELLEQESNYAAGVHDRLWPLLYSNIIRSSSKKIEVGKLNILDLSKFPKDTQTSIVEIILGTIWRQARLTKNQDCNLVIMIDEYQRLLLKERSILLEMMREARRYGITLILATQSVEILTSKKTLSSLNQAAITLYFQPHRDEIEKVAALINPRRPEAYIEQLEELEKGQSFVTGIIEINGKKITKPMIIHSEFGREYQNSFKVIGCNN